jgi:ureidoglycolate hydrolase
MSRPLTLETITPESVAPYGVIIDWSPELEAAGERFHVIMRSEAPTGWRLAVLKVRERVLERMENHPTTEELFAPIEGQSVIVLAEAGAFDESTIRAFLLDRPISLKPGAWHDVFTLSDWATILIAENLQVTGERVVLSKPVCATLD